MLPNVLIDSRRIWCYVDNYTCRSERVGQSATGLVNLG